jgi:hypothetical protein
METGSVANLFSLLTTPAAGWTVSVVGVFITIYLYFNPRRVVGRLKYKLIYPKSLLAGFFSRELVGELSLDVWNPSRNTLDAGAIWEPFTVTFLGDVTIEEASVDRVEQATKENFSISGVGTNALSVAWKYMDYGTAVRVAIKTRSKPREMEAVAESEALRPMFYRNKASFSGRFKDFVLEGPFVFEEYGSSFLLQAMSFILIIWTFSYYALLAASSLMPWLIHNLIWAALAFSAAFFIIFVAGIFVIIAANSTLSWLLNTNSPFEGRGPLKLFA